MNLTLTAGKFIVGKVGAVNLFLLLLLSLAASSLAWGLADAVYPTSISDLLPPAEFGVLAGWLLARTRLSRSKSILTAVLLGFLLVFLRSARFDYLGSIFLVRLFGFLAGSLRAWSYENMPYPDPQPLILAFSDLVAALGALAARLVNWIVSFGSRESAFDPVVSTMLWSWVLWSVSAWAGWFIRRTGQVFVAIAPGGILLAAIMNYVRSTPAPLVLLLAAVIALLVVVSHNQREGRWINDQLDYPSEIRMDLSMVVIPLALVILLAASLMPSISVRRLVQLTRQMITGPADQAADLGSRFGLLPGSSSSAAYEALRYPGLPRVHLIGSGPELSERVVMTIQVTEDRIIPAVPYGAYETIPFTTGEEGTVPSYYWRSLTYDQYTGLGWASTKVSTTRYPARQTAISSSQPGYRLITQAITETQDLGPVAYTTGFLVTADQDFEIAWRTPPVEEEEKPGDIFGVTLDAAQYQVRSLLPSATEEQLVGSGTNYPDWIRARYLRLPEDLPDRVRSLALDLTATHATPYERAVAIEGYLRAIPYTLDLPEPPRNQDIVDYFLFDLKRGYCDYYASSMVVLARAAGLPARLVMGFASGIYDEANQRYIVTEADAHSWVEVYFAGIGWVEFEPTGGRPEIDRPNQERRPPVFPEQNPQSPEVSRLPRIGQTSLLLALAAGLILLLGGFAVYYGDLWRFSRLSPAQTAAVLYNRLRQEAMDISKQAMPGDTPYELAQHLEDSLHQKRGPRASHRIMRPAAGEARSLVDLYVRSAYSQDTPDSAQQKQAVGLWGKLRLRLWLARRLR